MLTIAYEDLGRLLVSVCRLHHTKADQSMDQIGLYRGQALLLMTLSQQDGMTHSEIAEKLGISPAAATKVIKRMEQAQYLQRRADPADERISRVYLLDKGRALIDEINAAFAKLDRTTFGGLPQPELERLLNLLKRMQANLQGFQP
jgi:DNA-binding MarR family transcriptional regulator